MDNTDKNYKNTRFHDCKVEVKGTQDALIQSIQIIQEIPIFFTSFLGNI